MLQKGTVFFQHTVKSNKEYDAYLDAHTENLILMEVYADYCGYCVALNNTIRKCKLELGRDNLDLVKACSDKIDALEEFKYKSEPTFLFFRNRKLKRVMFGANSIALLRMCEQMLNVVRKEKELEAMGEDYDDVAEILPEDTVCV